MFNEERLMTNFKRIFFFFQQKIFVHCMLVEKTLTVEKVGVNVVQTCFESGCISNDLKFEYHQISIA